MSSSTRRMVRPARLEPFSASVAGGPAPHGRRVFPDPVQEQGGLFQETLGRAHALDDDTFGVFLEAHFLFFRKFPPGVDHDGQAGQSRVGAQGAQDIEPGHVGQAKVQNHAVEAGLGGQQGQGLDPRR